MNWVTNEAMTPQLLPFLRLLVLLVCLFGFNGALPAQEQTGVLSSEGPNSSVVMENGTPAMKFVSKDGSVAYVYFRKRGDEDSFAINVREFKFGGEKTGWMYFTRTRIAFESDDNADRNFDILKDEAHLKTERGHGGRWFIVKAAGKEKRFMVSFTPPRPLGKQQDPVFDVIERLITDYNSVLVDFEREVAELKTPRNGKELAPTTSASPQSQDIRVLSEFTSEPSGAEIYVDGVFAGSTPSKISVKAGEHVIKVIRPGYREWERRMTFDTSSSKSINAILEKKEP